MSYLFYDDEIAALEQQALFGKKEAQMVYFIETGEIILNRVLNLFDLYRGYRYNRSLEPNNISGPIYHVKTIVAKHSFFGLFNFTRLSRQKSFLGILYDQEFRVFGRDNLPFAKMFIEKLSVELKSEIKIVIYSEKGKYINFNSDDPIWLNTRRELLEQEQKRIESELADVYKRLHAIEGSGGPYRTISAIE